MTKVLNYSDRADTEPYVAKGSIQFTMDYNYPQYRIRANSLRKPLVQYAFGWNDYGYDAIGYDKMATMYNRWVGTHCDVEFRFTNITPYNNPGGATQQKTVLVHIQELNGHDTEIDPTDTSYQFEAQPKCTTLVLQSNSMGPTEATVYKRTLTGKELGGEYWNPTESDWSASFSSGLKPVHWFGVQLLATDVSHVTITSPMEVAVELRYTMYGNVYGRIPLDDV